MENLHETSEEEPFRLASQLDLRYSENQLMKTLTFSSDVVGPEASAIRFSFTDDSLIEEAGEDSIRDIEEEDQNRNEEEEAVAEEEEAFEGHGEHDAEEANAEVEDQEDEEDPDEDSETGEDEVEEEEEEEEEEVEEPPEEETILIDYQFPVAKDVKVKSDSDLSKIPSEVFGERSRMLQLLKDLVADRPDLTLRNRYLEYKSYRHLRTLQIAAGSPPVNDGSNLEDEAEKDRYMNFLGDYKKESERIRARVNQIKESLDYVREKVRARLAKDGETFGELTSRETAVAVDLVFATNGRRLTLKRVEDMIRRQTARRKQVAHERYTFIRRWYMFEEIDGRIKRLETLGPGMKISDYEADFAANLVAKTKIDEKNNELRKARARVCGIMAAITHGKVKLSYLSDEIDYKKNCHNWILESVQRQREALSSKRRQLSSTRNRYLKEREKAGLMLALPVLREMERVQDLRDTWNEKVDHMRSLIRKPRRNNQTPRSVIDK